MRTSLQGFGYGDIVHLICANLLIILIGAIFFWRLYQKNRP
ncbi:MAG: hypothetical protein O4965_22140 [Trichodesmium sp. St19_bin1]|nr:hypothetical protein [Trichodesmium sp. St19_bin1]